MNLRSSLHRSAAGLSIAPFAAAVALTSPLGAQDDLGDEIPEPDEEVAFESEDSVSDVELETGALKSMSLEELMNVEVTITSRNTEPLSDVPAPVYVITGDEILAAGHSSIQEALRMVPGLYVSHWTGDAWDVTSRGFGPGLSQTNAAYLNQLLVLVDGVTVYTPLYAGVWWSLVDVELADIDRIEVVRGPGGVLWGSNALHGVVHIITKKAVDTQGAQLTVHHGIDDRHVGVRYGGKIGDSGNYRVWVKGSYYDTPHNVFSQLDEDWRTISGGFRADWASETGRQFTVSTRVYESDQGQQGFDLDTFDPIQVDDIKRGYQILASTANPDVGSRLDFTLTKDKQDLPTLLDLTIDELSLTYQREYELTDSSTLSLGAGYRSIWSDLEGADPFFLDFDPQSFHQNIFRIYALDKISFERARTDVTLGVTLEHNEFTDFEFQPTARASFRANDAVTLWTGISRAVRTPSLEERTLSDMSLVTGNDAFQAVNVLAYEGGMRSQLCERVSMDVAVFYNDYDDLHVDSFNGTVVLPLNNGEGRAYGAEVAVDMKPTDRWTIRSAYSFIDTELTDSSDGTELDTDEYHPSHQFNLRSYYQLSRAWELGLGLYSVEGMGADFELAEYLRADARLAYKPSDALNLFVGIQNANTSTRSEFDDFDQSRRSVIFGLTWRP